MRTILTIVAMLLLLLTLPLGTVDGADFKNIDRLKFLVSTDLAFINSYTDNRERLVKANQASDKPSAVARLSFGVMQGILDIQIEFERLDNETTEAKKALNFPSPELQIIERDWSSLHVQSSVVAASLGSTPPTDNGDVLIQYRVSFDGKPVEGWRVGSVSYLSVRRDQVKRDHEIDIGCKPHMPPFIRSTTTSTKIKRDKLKKEIAFLEQELPPGQKYFWVQDDDCTVRSSPAVYENIQKVETGNCEPFNAAFGGCYPISISAPLEKPKYKKK